MRRAGLDISGEAAALAHDADPGVRREVALSMRDVPAAASLDILVEIASGYDGADRYYLEALGTGATGKEAALYERLRRDAGDALSWTPAFAHIAWRLHVPAAIADLATRAGSDTLPLADRQLALDALAFVDDPAASTAMLGVARGDGPLREPATWWLLNRMSNAWADHDLGPALKAGGIYDPDAITLQAVAKPEPPADLRAIAVDEVADLAGNAARGRQVAAQCTMCHTVEGTGASVGPALDGWGRGKAADVIAAAIINPDGDIAQGFGGTELTTTDGLVIQGLLIKQGDPLMMRS